jgi:hypothetical protein
MGRSRKALTPSAHDASGNPHRPEVDMSRIARLYERANATHWRVARVFDTIERAEVGLREAMAQLRMSRRHGAAHRGRREV